MHEILARTGMRVISLNLVELSDEEIKVGYSLLPVAVYSVYTRCHVMSGADLNLLHAALSSFPIKIVRSERDW
jgi:hypothetical protein